MTAKPPKGFVKLDRALLHGDAFTEISSNASRLLLDIMFHHDGTNNGSIRYGIAQATRWLHCGRSTALRAFTELREAGLIELTERGSFTDKARAQKAIANAWQLPFIPSRQAPKKTDHGS
jgi:hypothetical protein